MACLLTKPPSTRYSSHLVLAGEELIDHRFHLSLVASFVGDLHADDNLAFRVGGQLAVVSRSTASIAHLHDPCFGIGGRNPRLGFVLTRYS